MEQFNEDIEKEQIKRDLKTYAYHTSIVDSYYLKIYRIIDDIKDLYEASGIDYTKEPIKSSDSNFSLINEKLAEESHYKQLINEELTKRNRLGIDNLLNILNDKQREVIEMKYFKGLTFAVIAAILNYAPSTIKDRNKEALNKMVVYKKTSVDG